MSTADLQRLSFSLEWNPFGTGQGVYAALRRIHRELAAREERGAMGSIEIFDSCLRVFSHFRGPAHAATRVACLASAFNYLYAQGRADRAMLAAKLMASIGGEMEDEETLSKAHNALGIALADTGATEEAIGYLNAALDESQSAHNGLREIAVHINIGVALNYEGRWTESVAHLREAALVASPFSGAAYSNLAQSYAGMAEYGRALDTMDKALRFATKPRDAQEAASRVIRESTLVAAALEMRERELSERHAKNCIDYGRHAGERGRWIANLAIGRCQVRAGMGAAGIALLKQTLAECCANASMACDCLLALAKAHEDLEEAEMAAWYHARLDLFRRKRLEPTTSLDDTRRGC